MHLVVRTKYDGKIDFDSFSPLDPAKLVLELHARNGFNWNELAEALEAVPSLRITHEPFSDFYWQKLVVSGQIPASTVKAIAVQVFPNLDEIATGLQFAGDLDGCLQLVFLCCLTDRLRWGERIWDQVAARVPFSTRRSA